jgi:hypothetical protein
MAHFAELDINNKVIRVLTACNQDIANNGGELSEQAASYFQSYTPLSSNGVKYVQTSYNNKFRKKYAGIGMTYDSNLDMFIIQQPYSSWTLNSNGDWLAPITYPTIITYGENKAYIIDWDENNLRWTAKDQENNNFTWNSNTSTWSSL